MARPKNSVAVADEPQATVLEAKSVELGYERETDEVSKLAAQDFGFYVSKFVAGKHKDMHFAEVHIEDIRKTFLGWQPLKLDPATNDVTVAKSIDDTTRRGNLVLAWKTQKRYQIEQAEWQAKQNKHNRFVSAESHQTQAQEMNRSFIGLTGGKITASPLAADGTDN